MSDRGRDSRGVRNRDALTDHGDRTARGLLVDIVDGVFDALRPEALLDGVLTVEEGVLTVGSESYALEEFGDVYLVGSGKGSLPITEAVYERLDGGVHRALVVEKRGQVRGTDGIRVREADHPVPSPASGRAGEAVLDIAEAAGPEDLVIVVVTGGTSALLAAPAGDVAIEALADVTDRLLRAGAPIEDLNTVRKHLSRIKGGRLAGRLAPATVVGLIVVDEVAGVPWGPTVPDRTTPDDARAVLRRYGLWDSAPASVRDHLGGAGTDATDATGGTGTGTGAGTRSGTGTKGGNGTGRGRSGSRDTPRSLPGTVTNVVLADGADACEAAARLAREEGYGAAILSTTVEGESREVARALASVATEVADYGRPFDPPCVLVSGGETTVTIGDGTGTGGPNQEFALACAERIAGRDVAAAAVGTDGTDGPTDAAGGLVDGTTARRATERGVDIADALRAHDSTTALERLDDVVYTDPGTNVMDLRLFFVGTDGVE